jgi:hypothetical protein
VTRRPSPLREEGSGADRSSRTSPALSVLVMSGDAERRAEWAKFFEEQGMRTIRCAGPKAASCALEIGTSCPLHEHADLIFYDQESVTPFLEEQLDLIPLATPIAYASTMRMRDGRQYPITERVRPADRRGRPSR